MTDWQTWDQKQRDAILAVMKATSEIYRDLVDNATPENKRIYAVARAICEANRYDPDAIAMGQEGAGPCIAAKKTVALVMPIQPQWALFVMDARAAIAAIDAISQMQEKAA